jgi:hypothetical protein
MRDAPDQMIASLTADETNNLAMPAVEASRYGRSTSESLFVLQRDVFY